jgi:hypothetical protein
MQQLARAGATSTARTAAGSTLRVVGEAVVDEALLRQLLQGRGCGAAAGGGRGAGAGRGAGGRAPPAEDDYHEAASLLKAAAIAMSLQAKG